MIKSCKKFVDAYDRFIYRYKMFYLATYFYMKVENIKYQGSNREK